MRYVTSELIRFFNEESKMAFIAGPRQVGKTTLAKYFLDLKKAESFYFNWDIDSHQKNIISHPEDFWKRVVVTPTKGKQRISLDEIHKYPRWKRFLKGLYDDQKDELEIIVTGSGRLDLYQKGGDSLFGRYHLYHLYQFTVGELISTNRETVCSPENFWGILLEGEGKKNTEESLKAIETFTGFPEPLFSENIKHLHRWRQDHKKLVIREDLRDLTRIREIGILEILVSLLPERIGSPISINALREDLGVNFLTVQGWLEALERLYYIFKLRPYSGKLARTLRREEKIYLFEDRKSVV